MYYVVDGDDLIHDNVEQFIKFLDKVIKFYPNFKLTAFTIPALIRDSDCKYINLYYKDNVQLAMHGDLHKHREASYWTKYDARKILQKNINRGVFIKGFKAPYWVSSTWLEEVLIELEIWIAINKHPNSKDLGIIPGLSFYGINKHSIHGHVSDYDGGLVSMEESILRLPLETEFRFISEVLRKAE